MYDRIRPLILVVEDDAISASIVCEVLKDWADTEVVSRGAETHERALMLKPDLILLDVLMPETDGYAVCARLKNDPDTRDIPVIFVSSLSDEAAEARGLLAGAVDYVIKPISAPVLTARVRNHLELERQRRRLEREASSDDLTGLASRARLDEALEREWRRSIRGKGPVSLVAAGIDGFAAYTGMYGGRAADDCIWRVARVLAPLARRPADLIARLAPERFLLLLPGTDEAGALLLADRARAVVRALDLPHAPHGSRARVTLCAGVACAFPKLGDRPTPALERALACLERARAAGVDLTYFDDGRPVASGRAVPSSRPVPDPPPPDAAETVLIVDDDPLSVGVLSELLRGAGYEVETVFDSRRAVGEVRARRPDLILLDVLMPAPDGFAICAELKATPDTAETPVVFLSIIDDPAQKMRAFDVGGADYVGKSFHTGEILARIGHQLALRRLQREMRQANARLLEASRLKATFTAMLMHDLRSPLGAAQATIDMLARKIGAEDAELLELAEVSVGGLKQTVAMINEVLEIYRSEQVETMPLLRERIDLEPVLQAVLQEARLEARSRRVALELCVSGSLHTLGDRTRLGRAFGNLLGNALKFTRAGGKITVDARHVASNDRLRVEVRDTGAGIAEAEIPYIFDLYRQAAAGRQGGVGLGLAIVKRILDAHGAQIAVVSQLGVGTTFSIELPVAEG